jgi:hypothetical protein
MRRKFACACSAGAGEPHADFLSRSGRAAHRRLAELMIEHGIGVAEEHAYKVKKIDSDYFEES